MTSIMSPNSRVLMELDEARREIRLALSRLDSQRSLLNSVWSGQEMGYVNAGTDALCAELRRALGEVDSIATAVHRAPTLAGPSLGNKLHMLPYFGDGVG